MATKNKFYVVWRGKRPGIYPSWDECLEQVSGYKGAKYKGFKTLVEAKEGFENGFHHYEKQAKVKKIDQPHVLKEIEGPNLYSIAVDAASSGNPGVMEYRGVDTKTKKQLFIQGPFKQGTNNIGEFLAIVHGLAYLKERKSDRILYTDSRTAMAWVRKGKCNTQLKKTKVNNGLFDLVERAEKWLANNKTITPIVKWETRSWGEIPADFGRK